MYAVKSCCQIMHTQHHQFHILMDGANTSGCVALAPAKMQGLGRGSANLENPTVSVETLSLNSWYTSLKLFRPNLFRMCIRCLACFTESFFLA